LDDELPMRWLRMIAHVEQFAAPGAVFLSDRQAGNGSKGNPGGRLPLLLL
jgi:hypothetical protein